MGFENFSIVQVANICELNNNLGGFPRRHLAKNNYADWIKYLYEDLDRIIRDNIRPTASYRQDDEEDRFNMDIANSLKLLGYNAAHDTWSNGHPDILIELADKGYKWLGESKIYDGPAKLFEGFKQLSERYSCGGNNATQGALIVIFKENKYGDRMTAWKKSLSDRDFYKDLDIKFNECTLNDDCFYSVHKHNVSSNDYAVRHIPLSVFHEPTDKSALNRKK